MSEHDHDNSVEASPSYWMPIVKARTSADGKLWFVGLATDESIDVAGEVVKSSANPRCIDMINRGWAVMDWHHNSDKPGEAARIIGRPTNARFLSEAEARAKYPEVKVKGPAIEIEGYVNAIGPDKDLTPEDVKTAHYYAGVDEKLGLSIRAPAADRGYTKQDGKKVPFAVPGDIYKIAITPQPVNQNAPCYIVKAIGAALAGDEEVGVAEEDWQDDTPRLVVTSGVVKALTSANNIAVAGTQGGEALKIQDLEKRLANADLETGADIDTVPNHCAGCGCDVPADKKKCPQCGEIVKSLGEYLDELGEGLSKEIGQRAETKESESGITKAIVGVTHALPEVQAVHNALSRHATHIGTVIHASGVTSHHYEPHSGKEHLPHDVIKSKMGGYAHLSEPDDTGETQVHRVGFSSPSFNAHLHEFHMHSPERANEVRHALKSLED